MGVLKKLKKTIEKQDEPAILFVPSDTFDPSGVDVITVSDKQLYDTIYIAVTEAIKSNRKGVTRCTNSKTSPASRIIV